MVYDRTKERRKQKIPLRARAKVLRREQVSAEEFFWSLVRDRQLGGHKFRRQVPIGPFIVDFVCVERNLIVEFDGPHHEHRKNADRQRDMFLDAQGYEIFRFRNADLTADAALVLSTLKQALDTPSPHPSPPLKRGRG